MKFMTMNEVAESLSVSRMTVHRLIKSGQLKALKVNKSVRIPESSFSGYVEQNLKGNGDDKPKKRRFSLEGMIKDSDKIKEELVDQTLNEGKNKETIKKRRFSLRGMIKDGQVDDQALDEVKKIWESRELQ